MIYFVFGAIVTFHEIKPFSIQSLSITDKCGLFQVFRLHFKLIRLFGPILLPAGTNNFLKKGSRHRDVDGRTDICKDITCIEHCNSKWTQAIHPANGFCAGTSLLCFTSHRFQLKSCSSCGFNFLRYSFFLLQSIV